MHEGARLAVDVGQEVVGQQVVVPARGDGLHQGLEEVLPAKGAVPDEAHRILEALVQLQSGHTGRGGMKLAQSLCAPQGCTAVAIGAAVCELPVSLHDVLLFT